MDITLIFLVVAFFFVMYLQIFTLISDTPFSNLFYVISWSAYALLVSGNWPYLHMLLISWVHFFSFKLPLFLKNILPHGNNNNYVDDGNFEVMLIEIIAPRG